MHAIDSLFVRTSDAAERRPGAKDGKPQIWKWLQKVWEKLGSTNAPIAPERQKRFT